MAGQSLSDIKFATILHIATFIVGLALIGAGIKKFAVFEMLDPLDFIITIYYFIFGFMVCISELPFKSLLRCCSFLGFFWGKAIFFCFLATITFDYDDIYLIVISIALFISAGCYLILALACKKYIKEPEEDEAEAGKSSSEKQGFKPASEAKSSSNPAFPKPPELPPPNRV